MYDIIDSEVQRKKKSKMRLVFDPIIFTLFILIISIIIATIVYYMFFILPSIFINFDTLVSKTIPNELQFYHSLFEQHNQTMYQIETSLLKYLDRSEIILNNHTLSTINHIINNSEEITSSLNITLIQNNLNDIVNTLNRILPHISSGINK